MKLLNLEFTRISHDSFKIKGSRTIYTDPFKVTARDEADIVLISHEHFDHLSLEDLEKVVFPGTTIVASPLCRDGLKGLKVKETRFLDPGGKVSVGVDTLCLLQAMSNAIEFGLRLLYLDLLPQGVNGVPGGAGAAGWTGIGRVDRCSTAGGQQNKEKAGNHFHLFKRFIT